MPRILIIDDDPHFSHLLRWGLEERGHQVQYLEQAELATELLAEGQFDAVLLDNMMPGMTGIEFLAALERLRIRVPVILMTSHGTTATAIKATNLGAFDYVIKPLEVDELLTELDPLIEKALQVSPRNAQPMALPSEGPDASPVELLGKSKTMQEVCKLIGRVAKTDSPILIRGETGTGKELVARAIHANSARHNHPFIALNCTALNENLLDDELFGHEAGAFTGAERLRKGKFEYADGGTLFLDEIGDMPLSLQAKLLRVLELQEVSRIGSNERIQTNVRLVAATHRNLEEALADDSFRLDLYYRINGVTIWLPPLRDRGPDLEMLARFYLDRAAQALCKPVPELDESAWRKLRDYAWPGNVRQLQHVIIRAVVACRGAQIMPSDIELDSPNGAPRATPDQTNGQEEAIRSLRHTIRWAWCTGQPDLYPFLHDLMERELLRVALEELGGNQAQVAKRLGVARNTVRARMESYGLE